jgi:predicted RNA binding protein YcfA (HicA-like mRNA interferase family)
MPMSGKEVVRLLLAHGWQLDRISGSHYIMVKGNQTLVVPVHGNQDMKPGLLNAILKQAGLK